MSQVRQEHLYSSIKECHEKFGYPVEESCHILDVSRSAYYKWLRGDCGERTRKIASVIEEIHNEDSSKGYRRIRDDLEEYHSIKVNDKRVLRICRALNVKSTIKYKKQGCTRNADSPQYIAENILNRIFTANAPNEKWLTDVTEFAWYEVWRKGKYI